MDRFPTENRITIKTMFWMIVIIAISFFTWDLLTSSHVK